MTKPSTTTPGKALPRRCECGGRMKYARDFGMVFSYCEACTPVVVVNVAALSAARGEK